MRRGITSKKESMDGNMGVIGNNIGLNRYGKGERAERERAERVNSQRECCSRSSVCYRKKMGRVSKIKEGRNPFAGGELHGWEIRCERG
jgi:hypothetical protein